MMKSLASDRTGGCDPRYTRRACLPSVKKLVACSSLSPTFEQVGLAHSLSESGPDIKV